MDTSLDDASSYTEHGVDLVMGSHCDIPSFVDDDQLAGDDRIFHQLIERSHRLFDKTDYIVL
jgi:hypothetical protein